MFMPKLQAAHRITDRNKTKTTPGFQGITGSTLKIIALVTMLLDHIGAILIVSPYPYYALRLIGRIAFPIFCFLLVEGFLHTKNLKKYTFRLFLFALISEIPFDLAFHYTLYYPDAQNVFFTLLIGLFVISCLDHLEHTLSDKPGIFLLCRAITILAGMGIAWYLKTDYSYTGILVISLLHVLRRQRTAAMVYACFFLCLANPLEISSFVIVPLIRTYNGKRGLSLKYIFYFFYPLHLLILYLISLWIF